MRRFLIFALVGPPVGFFSWLWIILPVFNAMLGGSGQVSIDFGAIFLLPLAYMLGIIPALICCGFDEYLRDKNKKHVVLRTAVFSFVVAFVPFVGFMGLGLILHPLVFLFGFVGAIPGAVCSWLSKHFDPRPVDLS